MISAQSNWPGKSYVSQNILIQTTLVSQIASLGVIFLREIKRSRRNRHKRKTDSSLSGEIVQSSWVGGSWVLTSIIC